MAILAISNLSSYAWMLVTDSDARTLLGVQQWTSTESKDVSSQYPARLETLLKSCGMNRKDLSKIVVLNGPGTFTGLRNSLSFGLGLSASLKIPLCTLAAFDLYQVPFFIPTRHQMARSMDLAAALSLNLEFLKVVSATEAHIETPSLGDQVLGLQDRPDWPSPDEIRRALHAGRDLGPAEKIEIVYGLNPKISGRR
jgi:tRNA A37 threonylcarbamoyladenosine modification protein TsaB